MLDMNNLRKEKHEGLCKILDLVLIALFAVFFILSLFPYYSVSEGEYIVAKGYGDETGLVETTVKAGEDDSWSLLGYSGFPYSHNSVGDWQKAMFEKENKSTIKDNDNNGYKGGINSLLGKLGIVLTNEDGEKNPYEPLAVPGVTTKTVSIKQVGPILFLDVTALICIAVLLLKKGSFRAIFAAFWGVIGVLCFHFNYLLNMGNNAVKPIMFVLTIVVLVVGLVNAVLYTIDGRSRSAYLRSVSAAYA